MINAMIGNIYGDYKVGMIDGEVVCDELHVWTKALTNKPDPAFKTDLSTRYKSSQRKANRCQIAKGS